MPVSTNNLISIIKQNKNKKVLASKIIDTNPHVISVVPKLIQDRTASSFIEKNDFNINRTALESLYNRIRVTKQNNEHIIKLFPDIELAIQILVSSILSPKKMTDIQLNYKINKSLNISPTISGKFITTVKEHINSEYELEDKLSEIVREALFTSGAYIQAIIPESSVDDLINTDISTNYSAEDFKTRVDLAIETLTKPINLIPANNGPDTELTGKVDKNTLVHHMVSRSFVNITDNPRILSFSDFKDKITSNLVRSSFKSNTSISTENLNKVSYIDIFRKRDFTSNKGLEFIKKKTETNRKSLGKPLTVKLPTHSVIPVFIPGNESEHIGYFVLLDQAGKPLNNDINDGVLDQVSTVISQPNTGNASPIQKAYNNLVHDSTQGFNATELFDLYKTILEKQIYDSVKSSLYGKSCEIAEKNDIYFLMFTRALSNQKTNLLFIPKDLIVYFAFQYNEVGVGKTLLENLTILSSIRAILLFSKVMAFAKQSIDVTKVNVSLDPNDPDPEKTIEQIQDSVLKMRQNFFPLGMNNPVDLLNWIQRAGLQFAYDNNPMLPNVKIDFENANLSHTIPDSAFDEELRKQSIISLGLSPESVDNGFNPEFATSVVNNNILLSKRISVYQKTLTKHMSKFVDLVVYNDEILRAELRKLVLESLSSIEEHLTEEEKQELNKDKEAFIENYIDNISSNIEVFLPKPDNTNITTLSAEFDIYKDNLDKVIESVISPEIFAEDITGDMSAHVDTIKNVYRNYLLRKWMSENNFYPEVLEFSTDNAEEIEKTLGNITDHLVFTSKNTSQLFKSMEKFKQAINLKFSQVEGSAASPYASSPSPSYDSGSETGDESGEEEGGGDDIDVDKESDLDL